jgi:8-oxo-dGTP pyrophosphatase MutT (NUDIX family)
LAVPAATILILRDGAEGLEVFMVKRHYEVDFVAGALVFPGGKLSPADMEVALAEVAVSGSTCNHEQRALAAAAIREAFEESGILFACDRDSGEIVSAERVAALQAWRGWLEKGERLLADMLIEERLMLAYDELVPFAHWVTPKIAPKRYDTRFFLARAPGGQEGAHGGRESVDSIWIRPQVAIADREKWTVVFPTRLNLMKLGRSASVESALAAARSTPPVKVEPWVEESPEGRILQIRSDAGYEVTKALLRDAL